MLQTLTLKNWRSFREQTIRLVEPGATTGGLKILIGPNAAGKSNIVDAVRLLQQLVSGSDVESELMQRGGMQNVQFASAPKNENAAIAITVSRTLLAKNPHDLYYMVELGEQDDKLGIAKEVLKANQPSPSPVWLNMSWGRGNFSDEEGNTLPGIVYTMHPGDRLALQRIDNPFSPGSGFQIVKSLREFIRNWQFLVVDLNAVRRPEDYKRAWTLKPDASNLVDVLYTLATHDPSRLSNIQENLHLILEHVENVAARIERGRSLLSLKEAFFEDTFDARSISDGTLRLLAILTALETLPDPGLLVIEEPEHGLHPHLLDLLVDTFREYTEASRRQVLVTTHSSDFVDASGRPEEILVVERTESGESIVRQLDAEETRKWLEDFRLGELWSMRQLGGVPW